MKTIEKVDLDVLKVYMKRLRGPKHHRFRGVRQFLCDILLFFCRLESNTQRGWGDASWGDWVS